MRPLAANVCVQASGRALQRSWLSRPWGQSTGWKVRGVGNGSFYLMDALLRPTNLFLRNAEWSLTIYMTAGPFAGMHEHTVHK